MLRWIEMKVPKLPWERSFFPPASRLAGKLDFFHERVGRQFHKRA
jgi:hypothetical protein